MVLPLIGLLAAGAGSLGAMSLAKPWLDERSEDIAMRRRAQRAQNIPVDFLGRGADPEPFPQDFTTASGLLDPAVTPFDYNAQQIRSGLLAPEALTDPYGVALLGEQGAWDRSIFTQQNDQRKLTSQRVFDLDATFQPRFDALDTQLADLSQTDSIVSNLLGMNPSERDSFLGTPEGIATMNQLVEAEERGFSQYKKEVYGEAEPPPAELERLRSTYFGATGGGFGDFITHGGRLEQAREILDNRASELERKKQVLIREYQRNQDRLDLGGVQTQGPRGGVDLTGEVTASSRNAPGEAVGPQAMAIGQQLVGAGEVPDRDLLTEYLSTGGENMDPVTQAWCAAFLNASIERAGGRGTGSNRARSFLDWGEGVAEPAPGDIAVFSRGSNPALGHAGFFQGFNEDGTIRVLGGNQGDAVSVGNYDPATLLGYRRG